MVENRETIFNWLTSVTGLAVIRANQNGNRPDGPYVTYQELDHDEQGRPNVAKNSDYQAPETTLRSSLNLTLSVNIYDDNGAQLHNRLKRSSYNPVQSGLLFSGGIGLLSSGRSQDLTELGDNWFRPRYQADYILRVQDVEVVTPDPFEEVELIGTFIRGG